LVQRFQIYARGQTDRQTDHNTLGTYRGTVIVGPGEPNLLTLTICDNDDLRQYNHIISTYLKLPAQSTVITTFIGYRCATAVCLSKADDTCAKKLCVSYLVAKSCNISCNNNLNGDQLYFSATCCWNAKRWLANSCLRRFLHLAVCIVCK